MFEDFLKVGFYDKQTLSEYILTGFAFIVK